jgi:hypothetical protein
LKTKRARRERGNTEAIADREIQPDRLADPGTRATVEVVLGVASVRELWVSGAGVRAPDLNPPLKNIAGALAPKCRAVSNPPDCPGQPRRVSHQPGRAVSRGLPDSRRTLPPAGAHPAGALGTEEACDTRPPRRRRLARARVIRRRPSRQTRSLDLPRTSLEVMCSVHVLTITRLYDNL